MFLLSSYLHNFTFLDAGNGIVDCYIVDPHGRTDTVKPRITCPGGDGCFIVEYTPKEVGVHQVFVQFAEKQIPNSPFQVEIAPSTFHIVLFTIYFESEYFVHLNWLSFRSLIQSLHSYCFIQESLVKVSFNSMLFSSFYIEKYIVFYLKTSYYDMIWYISPHLMSYVCL